MSIKVYFTSANYRTNKRHESPPPKKIPKPSHVKENKAQNGTNFEFYCGVTNPELQIFLEWTGTPCDAG